MADEVNIGAFMVELFFGNWFLWIIIGMVMFIFILVMFKITTFFEDRWEAYKKRKNYKYVDTKITNYHQNGIVVETIIHIPKELAEQQDLKVPDLIAEVEQK